MNFLFLKRLLSIILILSIIALGAGMVYANDNSTDTVINYGDDLDSDNLQSSDDTFEDNTEFSQNTKISTKIEVNEVKSYYKEKIELIGYLKDINDNPISNKNIKIVLNEKSYIKKTNAVGKFILNLNLKANSYKVNVKFDNDEKYESSCNSTNIIIKKAPLIIKTTDYKTYFKSGLFFKSKVYNAITKNPIAGIKIAFKVYMGNGRYQKFYAVSDKKGIAYLKKNFKVGSYKVFSSIKKNNNVIVKNNKKNSLTIKPTAEVGCSSLLMHITKYESISGFRRDSTYSVNILIKPVKFYGRTAIKQYKTMGSYFAHSIITSDGWMFGKGGIDNSHVNKQIDNIAGRMIKTNKISLNLLKKIQVHLRSLSIGHFAIKSPDGKYAIVWTSAIKTGLLKPGKFILVPNSISCYRNGNYKSYDKNPSKAAVKIIASDSYGINRRDINVYHWKATTKEGSTSSKVIAYGSNDKGALRGMNTGYLKDNIYFKNKFFSKNSLPGAPSKKLLGIHKFGKIDKFIKTLTKIKAPSVTINTNQSALFKLLVKNKKTKRVIKNLKIKIKVNNKVFTVKTNSKGLAKLNIGKLTKGTYSVILYSANNRYYVNAKSKIFVRE